MDAKQWTEVTLVRLVESMVISVPGCSNLQPKRQAAADDMQLSQVSDIYEGPGILTVNEHSSKSEIEF